MKSNLATAAVCLAVFIVCAAAFFFLYQDAHPFGAVRLSLDADSAGKKAVSIGREVLPEIELPMRDAQLSRDGDLIRGVFAKLGHERGTDALREGVPGYFWNTQWKRFESGRVEVVTSDEPQADEKHSPGNTVGGLRIRLSTSGQLVGLEWNLPDTASVASVSPDTTRLLAEQFLRSHFAYVDNWVFSGEKKTELAHRTDIEYSWHGSQPSIGQPVDLKIKLAGGRILAAGIKYTDLSGMPEPDENKAHSIGLVILTVVLGIVLIIVAFRRSRAYEMSWRQGIILGAVMALLLAVEMYADMPNDARWETWLSLTMGPLFFGGAFILLWSVAESVSRETWRGKFTAFDLLLNGHVLHSRVGRSLLQGFAIGAAASLVWALLVLLLRSFVPTLLVPADNDHLMELGKSVAPIVVAAGSLTNNAYLFAAFVLFLLSLLRFRIRSGWLLLAVGAVAMGVMDKGGIMPLAAGIGLSTMVALVLTWGFYKFDVLASAVSFATVTLLMVLPALFTIGTGTCIQSGYLLAGSMAAVVALGTTGMLSHDRSVDLESITPAFVKHITERERLQRELEIARDVQMSFLPREDPVIAGVDIASRCVPALEVGGDYYDFVKLGADRFGVVVGDVSGKGTQAAFYMTLTKGFLKAVTRASQSPAEVLTQLNDLFYENVERGTFISMVYGIFDLSRRTVTIARAGHNPPLRKSNNAGVEFIQPAGLALGLEAGPTFAGTIREYSTGICPGDLFVFYTDGFTEAMNRRQEEYGEERLRLSVEKHASGTAAAAMDGILADVKAHAGKSKQHDDMTIVVVKTNV